MKTYSCGLNWFGPFTNIQQVKEWEDSNGNDTYLYLIRGKKKYAKKYVHLMAGQGTGQCPTHFSQATGETRFFRRTLTCPCATRRTSIYKGLATFHIRCSRNCQ